jgi:hypothetical protein
MKSIKKINYVVFLVITAATLLFTASCNKENLNEPAGSNEPVSLSDANKKIFNPFGFSPWHMKSSGTSVPERGIVEMSQPNQSTCYGLMFDNSGLTSIYDIAITHNGGATWRVQTIAELENNFILGVAATTERSVHVVGWNYVNGGGNVFQSTDGGINWQREAANAFTDPASFPDIVEFFDPQH